MPLDTDKMCIRFVEPWGKSTSAKSWLVEFWGIYDNVRPQHVELRIHDDVIKGRKSTSYLKMIPGSIYRLEELHRTHDTIAWNIAGLYIGERQQYRKAHFTVHKGERPLADFLPIQPLHTASPPRTEPTRG